MSLNFLTYQQLSKGSYSVFNFPIHETFKTD